MTRGSGSGRPLDDALAELRAVYMEGPPQRIESFLVAQVQRRRRRRAVRMWSALAAGVCAALLIPAYFVTRNDRPHLEKRTQVAEARKPAVKDAPVSEAREPVRAENFTAHPHARRVLRAKRNAPPAARASEAAEGSPFVVLPFAEPFAPSEQVDIYRVQVPQGALSVYGFPLRTAANESPVTADVAVGSDGVVRAVRFVR